MKKIKLLSISIVALTLLSACGESATVSVNNNATSNSTTGSSTPSSTTTATTTTTSTTQTKKLCDVLTPEDLAKILGYEVKVSTNNMPSSPTLTGCMYDSVDPTKGKGFSIIANYDNAYQTAKDGYKSAVDVQNANTEVTVTPISGVGEEAVLVQAKVIATVMAANKNTWVTVSRFGNDSANTELLKKIANKAFEVL